jgi:hypothetical protein
MLKLRQLGWVCVGLCLAFGLVAVRAADTNSLVWHRTTDRVDADVRDMALRPLLEKIASDASWRIYVEPGVTHVVSAKFKNLPSVEALRMLFGDLNFALVPQTNAVPRLYVFRTVRQNATQLVRAPAPPAKHVPNELLVKLKPGADIDALAKLLGAKITGRNDKLGLYRLLFDNASATDAALAGLKNNSDVAAVDYNYYYDPPPTPQLLSSAPVGPLSLTLNPPGDSGKVIVGLPDTAEQSLGAQLDKFILPQLSVVGDANAPGTDLTHGTAMAYSILESIAQQSGGGTSVQILPVDIYDSGESTTSWNVALGIQKAVDNGATILNLSLGGVGDSPVLDNIIQQAIASGIPVIVAAGNTPGVTTYPAATQGVIPVTALGQPGQLASYANFWPDPEMIALPGASVVYFNGQPWGVQGTSVATAYATGMAAENRVMTGASWAQIIAAMQQKFAVPAK